MRWQSSDVGQTEERRPSAVGGSLAVVARTLAEVEEEGLGCDIDLGVAVGGWPLLGLEVSLG